jgi:ATP-binding cassette subfamily B protein
MPCPTDSRQRGEVLSRVTNDVDNIQSSLSMTISQFSLC